MFRSVFAAVLCGIVVPLIVHRSTLGQESETNRAKNQEAIDKQLFDDLDLPARSTRPPASKSPAGEDLGKPSDRSLLAEVGRQMREVESRLRQQDTSQSTRQLQKEIFDLLTELLNEQEKQQQAGASSSTSAQEKQSATQGSTKASTGSPAGSDTGRGTGASRLTPPQRMSQFAEQIWGVMPDRIQQRMQAIGDEQFLPQFEERIQQYYERLAERNKKK